MLKKLLIFILFSFVFMQEQSIANIAVSQRTDGSGIIDISYDLNDPEEIFPSFEIDVEISFDNGNTWESASGFSPNGDFGTVTPGIGKHITLYLYEGLYSSQAKIKLIGSGHYVTSDLPFATVVIPPSDIMIFESETIDYSFEIMQYELTNAQLVSFLETYPFTDAANYDTENPWTDTAEAMYDCGSYNNYYIGDSENPIEEEEGCMNTGALNYNPYGTYQEDDCTCIFPSNLGCSDGSALNYIDAEDGCEEFDDCSCSYPVISPNSIYSPSCPNEGEFEAILNDAIGSYIIDNLEIQYEEGFLHILSTCTDPLALNYLSELTSLAAMLGYASGGSPCLDIIDDGSCVYECANTYEWQNETYENPNAYSINSFQTQDISLQGSAFTISPQKGDHPVKFDAMSCIDSIVLTLYMEYFGLRIPTAGEWMKSARGDNTRCWPWMNGSCQEDAQLACDGNCINPYNIDECSSEIVSCIDECEDISNACSSSYQAAAAACMEGCFYTETYACLMSGDFDFTYTDETSCLENGGLEWISTGEYAYPSCAECVDDMSGMQWSLCFSDTGGDTCYCDDFETSVTDACSECAENCGLTGEHPCDSYNPFDDENICVDQEIDIDGDGTIDNPSCFGEYSDYCITGNCDYENCNNSSDTCWDDYNNCAGIADCMNGTNIDEELGCSDYNIIDAYELSDISSGNTISSSSFIQNLYANRMNYFLNSTDVWELTSVGSYPSGVSSYGLYDVIGNVPELVSFSGASLSVEYYLLGTSPIQTQDTFSFCSESSFASEGGHQATKLMDYYSDTINRYYGVRLIRTVAEE